MKAVALNAKGSELAMRHEHAKKRELCHPLMTVLGNNSTCLREMVGRDFDIKRGRVASVQARALFSCQVVRSFGTILRAFVTDIPHQAQTFSSDEVHYPAPLRCPRWVCSCMG
jgi:hypothetical protein